MSQAFIIGFSLGGGTTFCTDGCGWNDSGLLDFHIGGMQNDRTSLQYEGTGVAFYQDDTRWTCQLNSLSVQAGLRFPALPVAIDSFLEADAAVPRPAIHRRRG